MQYRGDVGKKPRKKPKVDMFHSTVWRFAQQTCAFLLRSLPGPTVGRSKEEQLMIRSLSNRVRRIEDGENRQNKVLVCFIGYSPGEADRKKAEYVQRTGKEPAFAFLMNLGGSGDGEEAS
jgi:hypothetical protein